ncbi:MAG: YqgE/AlgH family protein [Planctomycetota bacterium]
MQNYQVGDLLVASSLVDSTVLQQSVCLLVYGDDENAIGVMLNRPMQAASQVPSSEASTSDSSNPDPSDELAQSTEAPAPRWVAQDGLQASSSLEPKLPSVAVTSAPGDALGAQLVQGSSLHFGGPLAGPIVAVHGASQWAEAEAGDGIFVAAQRDNLEGLLQQPDAPFRLIVGHLGWAHDQLDHEITDGIWHRIPGTAEVLSTDDSVLWPKLIRRATANSVARWMGAPDHADAGELN